MANGSKKKVTASVAVRIKAPADPRVVKVLAILQQNPQTPFKLLATAVGLSQSRAEHLFKDETGQTLTTYVLAQRLLRASILLRDTTLKVKEIADFAGYAHVPSFVRAFKLQYGVRPRAYRLAALTKDP